ncbi:hypothetical protein GCM10018987_39200 [Streptomyces cremeus]
MTDGRAVSRTACMTGVPLVATANGGKGAAAVGQARVTDRCYQCVTGRSNGDEALTVGRLRGENADAARTGSPACGDRTGRVLTAITAQ